MSAKKIVPLSDDDKAWELLIRGGNSIEDYLKDYDRLTQNADILVRHSYWPSLHRMDFSHEANAEVKTKLQNTAEEYIYFVRRLSEAPEALDELCSKAERYYGSVTTQFLRDRLSKIASNASRTAREVEVLPHDMPPIGGHHTLQSPELIRLAGAWLRQKHANIIFKARGSLAHTGLLLVGDEEEPDPTDTSPLDAPDVWKHRYEARMRAFDSQVVNRSFRDEASTSVSSSPRHRQANYQEESVTSDPHAPWQGYQSSPDNYEYIDHFSDACHNLHHR